jgi:hypothetical protein
MDSPDEPKPQNGLPKVTPGVPFSFRRARRREAATILAFDLKGRPELLLAAFIVS